MNALYSVNLWGSHPDDDNDDCWTGEEFATLAEATNAFDSWDTHFAASDVLSTSHVELDGPDVHEVKQVRASHKRNAADREWQRERALEAGMCLGIDAYNEMMGYD